MKQRQSLWQSTRGKKSLLHFKTMPKSQIEQFQQIQPFNLELLKKPRPFKRGNVMGEEKVNSKQEQQKIPALLTLRQHTQDQELNTLDIKHLKTLKIPKQQAYTGKKKPKPNSSLGCKILLRKNTLFPFLEEKNNLRKTQSLDRKKRSPSEVQLFQLNISEVFRSEELPYLNFISKKSYEQILNI